MTFRAKILVLLSLVGLTCTGFAILVATLGIKKQGKEALIDKSRAILSRVEVGSKYIAEMGNLKSIVEEAKTMHPNGKLTEETKMRILKNVPVYAAFKIGQEGAAKENYQFRIASNSPRNKEKQASPEESKVIEMFKKDPSKTEYIHIDEEKNQILITVPSKISEARNCLVCHGHPSNSPWGNGLDILGYQMEDLKDGDIRASFSIISSLDTVDEQAASATLSIVFWGLLGTLITVFFAYISIGKKINSIQAIASRIQKVSSKIKGDSGQLSTDSEMVSKSVVSQASSVEQVSASISEISSMVSSTVTESQSSVDAAKNVDDFTNDSLSSMQSLEKSVSELSDNNEAVENLVNLIKEIEEKTAVIDDIVFKTTLLSFNASIEAARAGEHGRGFAVVAQEVGNLAQMSGISAAEIGEIVKEVTKTAQDVAESNRTKTEVSLQQLSQTSEKLQNIHSASRAIAESAENVLHAAREQHSGVEQIQEGIQQINSSTQNNANIAEKTNQSSHQLLKESSNLEKIANELNSILEGKDQKKPLAKVHKLLAKKEDKSKAA